MKDKFGLYAKFILTIILKICVTPIMFVLGAVTGFVVGGVYTVIAFFNESVRDKLIFGERLIKT